MQISSIVLCAGKGTRMKTESPKVVQTILGCEMVNYVLSSLQAAGIKNHNIVVGYKKDEVIEKIPKKYKCNFIEQKRQLGTGHAVKTCSKEFSDKTGITIITCGDTPLVSGETFKKLIKKHKKEKNYLTILTADVDNPSGYGRIVRNDVGSVIGIVEEKDATTEIKQIKEINSGIYCFDTESLFKNINKIKNTNSQKEYYLTDLVEIFNQKGLRVSAYKCSDSNEIKGVNDLIALDEASKILQQRINQEHQKNGVKIIDSDSTYIGPDVTFGKGVIVEPGNSIYGNCKIGDKNHLKAGNTIIDSKIGDSNLIGPNAHIHTNSKVGNNCKVGNFVELKNTTIGNGSKAAHLTYLGDTKIGVNTNIGCGVITANYDGVHKHKTIIGDNCFIGSNVTLIAPIKVNNKALIAAGSTVTLDNVAANKLIIARSREVIKNRKK